MGGEVLEGLGLALDLEAKPPDRAGMGTDRGHAIAAGAGQPLLPPVLDHGGTDHQ